MDAPVVHPLHIRIAHWVNACAVFVLLWTGFAQLLADRHYAALAHLVPAAVWNALQLTGHRVPGRAWHLAFAIVFMANAVVYLVTSLRSGSWRRLQLRGRWLRDAVTAAIDNCGGRVRNCVRATTTPPSDSRTSPSWPARS